MTDERPLGEEEKPSADSYPPDKKVAVPNSKAGAGTSDDDDSKPKLGWFAALTGAQLVKELLVIFAAVAVLVTMLNILADFFSGISGLFAAAVKLHSAPIAVVKSFDWHLVLLGVSLVAGISTIVIVLLKSVFNGGGSSGKTADDGLKLTDYPIGALISAIRDIFNQK